MQHSKNLTIIMLLTIALTGCMTPRIKSQAPTAFAAYQSENHFRAVTPDGVVYRLREFENKPKAALPFWRTALKTHLLDSGYHLIDESDIETGENPGYLLELAAPIKNQDYSYLIALFVKDKQILLVESAGEISKMSRYREQVIAEISKLTAD